MKTENKYICPRCKSIIEKEDLIQCDLLSFENSYFKCFDCSQIFTYNELIIRPC